MPTSLTVQFRCMSKTLVQTGIPGATDAVSVQLTQSGTTAVATAASCSLTIPVANDTFVMGSYYDSTIVDGVALDASAMSERSGPFTSPGTGPGLRST